MNNKNDCNKANFKPPVKWLMGRELLAGLKWIAVYTFMGDKQDPKDWMKAEIIKPPRENNKNNNDNDPYWFDFIADTGDGMSAVYNIAYLCMSDLWIDAKSSIGPDGVALSKDDVHTLLLPRGEFLYVGGDTAYHIADTASLKERFQTPFNCAYADLLSNGKTVYRRPIYGVPANHDYYDALDGFNRQLCKPISEEAVSASGVNDETDPQLGLKGFYRSQTASYVALQLPFEWQIWGLDAQEGKMDKRQQAFFVSSFRRDLVENGELFNTKNEVMVQQELQQHVPTKLIVTTPEPTTVFGKLAKKDAPIVKTFQRLGLEPSFIKKNNDRLSKDKCRLDLSGDIHHYERYWGSSPSDSNPTNYASVVAGGGGAFLHPSHTDLGEATRIKEYPERKDSHVLFTQAMLNPIRIFQGGYIWLVGGLIAFLSYFAVTIPKSTVSIIKRIFDGFSPDVTGGNAILSRIKSALDIANIVDSSSFCSNGYCFDLSLIILFTALLAILWRTPRILKDNDNEAKSDPNIWQRCIALFMSPVKSLEANVKSELDEWQRSIALFMLPMLVGTVLLLLLIFVESEKLPHPLLAGLLIDFFFIAAILLFTLSCRYRDVLADRAKTHQESHVKLMPSWIYEKFGIIPEVSHESLPLWGYILLGVAYAAFGFLRYGVYATSVMTFDLLIIVVWLMATLGLIALAIILGGQLHATAAGKIRFALIGTWHAVLQTVVPVYLVLYADWQSLLLISASIYATTLAAGKLFTLDFLVKKDFPLDAQKTTANLLFAAWVIVSLSTMYAVTRGEPIAVDGWRLAAAFVVGALFSCIWFGWYLAVSLASHGHNNEAGGGGRSEQYRHMIRFKLTQYTLTGYVIGIDRPVKDFTVTKAPTFQLVDVFTIQLQK